MNCSEPFIESGMTFGPFPDGSCFPIEQSASYKAIESGVKMAEFLLLRQELLRGFSFNPPAKDM